MASPAWSWSVFVITSAFSHLRRVRLIVDRVDASTISNRQRRQIEIPFEAGEAFDCSTRRSANCPHRTDRKRPRQPAGSGQAGADRALRRQRALEPVPTDRTEAQPGVATVTPGDDIGSVT
jgi:hypothetical protein